MQRVIDKLLPWGTRRRRIFQMGVSAISIIRNQGWRVFVHKASQKFKQIIHYKSSNYYKIWISKYEPDINTLELQRKESSAFKYSPKISIITPVYNTDPRWLKLAIESVIKQTYCKWELCIADGGSSNPDINQILKEYSQKDERIKTIYLKKNFGISGNSNRALALATGEFILLLDHDDELAPFALFEIVKILNEKPDLDFIYSDEDKLTIKNERIEPVFKPDWSPDLILSCMYTCHLGAYRKTIIDEIQGFRSEYDGSQDYDLVLRFMDRTSNIYHIPKILYHWRVVPGSAAVGSGSKPYAYLAGKEALKNYLHRNNIPGEVKDGPSPGLYRIYRRIVGNPLVSIIIPSKDNSKYLNKCVESILTKTEYSNYEIIIVDNQSCEKSTFEYYAQIKANPRITILNYNQPFNFSSLNNYAVSKSKGEYILFLNNDTEVISGEWLSAMLEHSQRKEVGAVGAQLFYLNNSIQHCGIVLGLQGISGHLYSREFEVYHQGARNSVICNYSAVTGACMMMRKSLFNELGGFDTDFTVGFNDIDICLRLRKQNYLIVYTPYAILYHYESLTRGYDEDDPGKRQRFQKEMELMQARWGALIVRGDPYYNPNLSLVKSDYSLKQ